MFFLPIMSLNSIGATYNGYFNVILYLYLFVLMIDAYDILINKTSSTPAFLYLQTKLTT